MLTGDLRTRSARSTSMMRSQPTTVSEKELDPKTKARMALESVGFDLQESQQYIEYARGLSGKLGRFKGGFRWLYLCAAGFGAGAVAVAICSVLKLVNEAKVGAQEQLFQAGYGLGVRYLAWVGSSLVLAAVAGFLVCYVEPLAAGSGIPEIKCILNGIDLPNVLRMRTLVAKALGIVCSVAAGLPCGREGPMIHSGAIVAAQFTGASAGPLPTPYRITPEARDMVAAGAAAGVAAAFGAPIGGVLFAVEEGASHMNPTILVRTFVCSAVAALMVRFFAGPRGEATAWGTLGADVPVEFGRFAVQSYTIFELPVFALLGIFSGFAGALFNFLNLKLSLWRMRWVGPRGHWRFLEVLIVTAVIISFNFFAPLIKGGSTAMGDFDVSQTLFVASGDEAIKQLFHGQERIDPWMLLFFALIHYLQTVWTYGLGVPSGLFVPSLLGGAAFGRLVGQAAQGVTLLGARPGVYALVGAAAMLSGMARITISLVVILMETTGDAEFGVPIFIVVMAAKWVGDVFNEGIYDLHIHLRHVPLLEHRPEKHLLALRAGDCMAAPVVCAPQISRVQDLMDMVASCRHHAFPVVQSSSGHFVGMVERNTLMHVLLLGGKCGAFSDCAEANGKGKVAVSYSNMIRHGFPQCPPLASVREAVAAVPEDQEIDLAPYANKGSFTVEEDAAANRCYVLFRTLGLRHVPVLGPDHTVRGIITRKDLLAAAEHGEHGEHGASAGAPSPASEARKDSPGECGADGSQGAGLPEPLGGRVAEV
uniref:Chloride channel protein n=1 Tax=Zooxanthella nutricula TaxID=1333877 RepID=A0A7S2K5L0_9DINO